jgi:hypothetical protein
VEVTVALAVITIVMGVAFALLNGFQQTYRYEEANAEAQRNARFAIARLNEIIRSAGTNPTSNAAVNNLKFVEIGDGGASLRLRSDLDGDGATSTAIDDNTDVIITSEDVTLRLVDGDIQLIDNTGAAPEGREILTIANNINTLRFSDPDGSSRRIVVDLTAVPSGMSAKDPRYREVSFTSTIRLRNR